MTEFTTNSSKKRKLDDFEEFTSAMERVRAFNL